MLFQDRFEAGRVLASNLAPVIGKAGGCRPRTVPRMCPVWLQSRAAVQVPPDVFVVPELETVRRRDSHRRNQRAAIAKEITSEAGEAGEVPETDPSAVQ